MKKTGIFFVVLYLLIFLNIIGCSNKKDVAISEKIEDVSDTYLETSMKNIVISNKVIADVFENKKKFFDTELQKYIYLSEYSSTNYMDYDTEGKYEYVDDNDSQGEKQKILRWCEIDMNSDGNKEVLLELSSSNILLLHSEEGVVYGYAFNFRGMNSIKTDGSFQGSDSAATTYIGKIKFVGKECFYEEICVIDELNDNDPIYRIDKQESTKEEVQSYLEKQEAKENIVWNYVE